MAAEKALKDVCGVYARLFDHRAVLQSESKYMIKEFESKRNDREIPKLKELAYKVNNIQQKIPDCVQLGDKLQILLDDVKEARAKCHEIVLKEEQDENRDKRETILQQATKQWENFLKEMEKESEKIDKEYEEKAQKLREKYGVTAVESSTAVSAGSANVIH